MISIITLLAALLVVVATGVVRDSAKRLTRSTITALEAAIETYEDKNDVSVRDSLGDLIRNYDQDQVKVLAGGDVSKRLEYLNIEALTFALTTRNLGGPFIELKSKQLINKNRNYYDFDDNGSFDVTKGDFELFEIADGWGEPLYYENPQGKGGRRHRANLNETKPDIWSAGPDGTSLCDYVDDNGDGKYDEDVDRAAKAKTLDVPNDDIVNWE